jgi:hypothetical protein
MTRAIHHWPTKRIVIVVAAATALLKGRIIPKMKKGIPSTCHFEDMHIEKFKGPPRRAFFYRI